MKPTLLLVVLLVPAAPTAIAGQDTGNDLLRQCEPLLASMAGVPSTDDVPATFVEAFQQGFGQGECLGRIAGISSVAGVIRSDVAEVCVPDGVSDAERIRVVFELLDRRDGALIVLALQDAFPCQ